MKTPIQADLPQISQLELEWRGHQLSLPYLYRAGRNGPSILFVHGLGGAKENFLHAFQSPALADCELLAFDEPGTGLAPFVPGAGLDVSALADLTSIVADRLLVGPFFLAGASMGGLISLLYLRRHGADRVLGFINLEGNLLGEDCMFSRRVVAHPREGFEPVFQQMATELGESGSPGNRMMASNMALNIDIDGYHAFSFETVAESDSGRLLDEFLELNIPRLFIYGEENRGLSYLSRLRDSSVKVTEIPSSAHFMFYDNPVATFEAVGSFVREVC